MGHQEVEVSASYTVRYCLGKALPNSIENFVILRWMSSYREGNDYIKLIDSDAYHDSYRVYVRSVFNRPDAVVRLAVLSDDFDVVLGFSVIEGSTLHYVYVKKDFRRQGIARSLVPRDIDAFTHLTRTGLMLWSSKKPRAKFNPFA